MHGMSQVQAQTGRDGFIHGPADHVCTSLLLRKPRISKGTHAAHAPQPSMNIISLLATSSQEVSLLPLPTPLHTRRQEQ